MYPMPSLQHLAPSQLITLLQQFNTTNNHAIYPIWLNNEGQNVIGLLPKTIFEISYISLPKSNVKIAHSMILVTVIL